MIFDNKREVKGKEYTEQTVKSITEEYYLSTSKDIQVGGSWGIREPQQKNGKYIWVRSKIVYSNPTSAVYTSPICMNIEK